MDTSKSKYRKISPVRWVPTLYFAMGLPFVVLNMVSAVMFKDLGVSDAKIAFWTSLIMWPWTIKFLWSPVLELYRTRKFFVVLTQIVSGVLFGLVALSLSLPSFFAVSIALLAVVAFSGATHDIVADGTYMSELNRDEQARWIGWQGAFYNIAKLAATGGLVWLAGWIGDRTGSAVMSWTIVFAILGALMLVLGLYHWRELPCSQTTAGGKKSGTIVNAEAEKNASKAADGCETATGKTIARSLWNGPGEVFADFFRKRHIWYYIAFIIVYRLGEGFVIKIVPLFMMQQVAPGRHQTAHYAIASGIMNLSVMLTGAVSGFLSDALGYRLFFIAVMAATVPAFIMTKMVPFTHPDAKDN